MMRRVKNLIRSHFPFAVELLARSRGRHPSQMWGRVFDLRRKKFVELNGFGLYVMPDDYIGYSIMMAKIYEPHVTKIIAGFLKKGDVFLDVGANIGYFTMLAATMVGKSGKVIAFEPNPQNLQLIYSSLLENKISNVVVYPYAVSDEVAILPFTTVGSNGGVVTKFAKSQLQSFLVPSVLLDETLKDEVTIDLMKIDIEAHEPAAIRGMEKLIRQHKPRIITEFHPWAMKINNPEPPTEYLEQLYGLGYKISIIGPSGELVDVDGAEDILSYWQSMDQETAHLDLLAQPV